MNKYSKKISYKNKKTNVAWKKQNNFKIREREKKGIYKKIKYKKYIFLLIKKKIILIKAH